MKKDKPLTVEYSVSFEAKWKSGGSLNSSIHAATMPELRRKVTAQRRRIMAARYKKKPYYQGISFGDVTRTETENLGRLFV
jgi:hypothetical protein